jgi:hypothetical protein
VSPRVPVPTPITNVIATLKGTDPASADRVYVVSGHYDSRVTDVMNFTDDAPGADDDGSAISAVLELARVMAGHPSEATVVFAAFAGEEQGLYGSQFFARQEKAAGANVEGDLNMDIIGSSLGGNGIRDPHTIRLFSEGVPTAATADDIARLQSIGGENDSAARQLARYVKETGQNSATRMRVKLVWRRDRFLRGGDQISFLQQGYPAVRFTEPNENFDHQHQDVRVENGVQFGDLPQFVDFRYLARVTRVGRVLAGRARARAADADERPHRHDEPVVRHRAPLGSRSRARCRRLRGRLARLDVAAVDPRAQGRQRHRLHDRRPQQGRQPGRRAGDRPRRQPQPGRLPAPAELIGAAGASPPAGDARVPAQ